MRNLALNAMRGDRRRRKREISVARGEALPSTEAIADQLALQRAVTKMVLELEEPYHTTILLRYYQNLSPEEIAEHAGIPLATVWTRIHRGLARLRARLDRLHAGDRGTWCAGLVQLLGSKAVETASLSVSGAFMMGLKLKFLLTATALLVSLLLVSQFLFRGPHTDQNAIKSPCNLGVSKDRPASDPCQGRSNAVGLTEAPVRKTEPALEDRKSTETYFSGRVVDDGGAPVASASVRVFRVGKNHGLTGPVMSTGPDGCFSFESEFPGNGIRVQVSAPGKASVCAWVHKKRRARIMLLPGCSVQVLVLDERTRLPIDGALVVGESDTPGRTVGDPRDEEKTTGSDGKTTLILGGRVVRVFVSRTGYASHTVRGVIVTSRKKTVTVRLGPGGTVVGRCVDLGGHPVQGVCVRGAKNIGNNGSFRREVTTGERGDFRFEDIPYEPFDNARLILTASHDGYATAVQFEALPAPETCREVMIVLSHGFPLAGRVRWKDGTPAVGVEVFVLPESYVFWHGGEPRASWLSMHRHLRKTTLTDENGRYQFMRLPSGPIHVEVEQNHTLLGKTSTTISRKRGRDLEIKLDRQEERSNEAILVRVLDVNGNPLAGARVSVLHGRANPVSAETDKSGSAQIRGLPRRDLVGFIVPPAGMPLRFTIGSKQWRARVAVVQLKEGGVVAGRVFRASGSPAVIAVSLRLVYKMPEDPKREKGEWTGRAFARGFGSGNAVVTGPDGRFKFEGVGEGEYTLRVDQRMTVVEGPKTVHGGSTNIRLVVATPGEMASYHLDVLLVDAVSGRPLDRQVEHTAQVWLRPVGKVETGRSRGVQLYPVGPHYPGLYRNLSDPIPPGEYDVRVEAPGYSRARVPGVWIMRGHGPEKIRVLLERTRD